MVITAGLVSAAATVAADDEDPPRDIDQWHQALEEAIGGPIVEEPVHGWDLGLYPTLGVVAGPPEWLSYQLGCYVSMAADGRFSLFAGYGYERGWGSETHMATIGWGGVRRLTAGRSQRGFYGKFLRYRRLNDFDHGIHHGLSVGVEHGVGAFGLSVEFGAARSARNHWAFAVQLGAKIALPVIIPLSRAPGTAPDV